MGNRWVSSFFQHLVRTVGRLHASSSMWSVGLAAQLQQEPHHHSDPGLWVMLLPLYSSSHGQPWFPALKDLWATLFYSSVFPALPTPLQPIPVLNFLSLKWQQKCFFSPDWAPLIHLTSIVAKEAITQQTVLQSCPRKQYWSLHLKTLLQPFFSVIQESTTFPTLERFLLRLDSLQLNPNWRYKILRFKGLVIFLILHL